MVDCAGILDPDTLVSYRALYNKHFRDTLGGRKLKNIHNSDLKKLYTDMVEEKGLAVSTAQSLNSAVGQMFQAAVDDEILRRRCYVQTLG